MAEQRADVKLRTINVDGIADAGREFDSVNAMIEAALQELLLHFPFNNYLSHVLLKVTAINALYYTGILAIQTVAQHIHDHYAEVDRALDSGAGEVVDLIANVKIRDKVRNNYSFATKYCSWHRPDAYPIWDSRVDRYIWQLRKQERIPPFSRTDLYDYSRFRGIIDSFRETFDLQSSTYKQIDKFLFVEGEKLFNPASNAPTAIAPSE